MKKALIFLTSLLLSMSTFAGSLAKELQVFEPYLGTWQADFAVPKGQPAGVLDDVLTKEIVDKNKD